MIMKTFVVRLPYPEDLKIVVQMIRIVVWGITNPRGGPTRKRRSEMSVKQKSSSRFGGDILSVVYNVRDLFQAVSAYVVSALDKTLGNESPAYWTLALVNAKANNQDTEQMLAAEVPASIRNQVKQAWKQIEQYFDSGKYGILAQQGLVMATIGNCLRVISGQATDAQKKAFGFASLTDIQSVHEALKAATIGDQGFTAPTLAAALLGMPASDLQALGAFCAAEHADQGSITTIGNCFVEGPTNTTVSDFSEIGVSPGEIEATAETAAAHTAIAETHWQRQSQQYAS